MSSSGTPVTSRGGARAPDWLRIGAVVYDRRLHRWGRVMDVAYPRHERRQSDRAWLRPLSGGLEWNPVIEDLSRCEDNGDDAP